MKSIASIVRRRSQRPAALAASGRADRGGEEAQGEDAPDRGGRVGELQHQRHERDGAHPVAERRDRLADEEVPEAGPADERHEAHDSPCVPAEGSWSNKSRWRYTCPGLRPSPGAGRELPTTRFTIMGTTMHDARDRAVAPVGDREHRGERHLSNEAPQARLPEPASHHRAAEHKYRARPRVHEQRADGGRDAPTARTLQERRPVVTDHRGTAGERSQHRSIGAGEQRAERTLGDVEDARGRERDEPGDAVQRGAGDGAGPDLAQVDAAGRAGDQVRGRHGAHQERQQ